MGTPESIKRKRAFREQEDNEKGSEGTSSSDSGEEESDGEDEGDGASDQSSSSSPSEDEGGEKEHQQQSDQVMELSIDLSVSPTDPDKASKETSAAPVNRLSFKQALEISKNNRSQGAAIVTSTGTGSVPSHRRLITLSSLGIKKDDSANKRTRTSSEPSNDQEQPVSKKPPQNSDPIPNRQTGSEVVPGRRSRNQEKEEAIQEEVRRSAQNVRWTKGPLPSNIDHWFYDLREAGTVPPPSLVAASRNMVLRWKAALGRRYYPHSESAGGSVMLLEHALSTGNVMYINIEINQVTINFILVVINPEINCN
jgi:hypothetical protein